MLVAGGYVGGTGDKEYVVLCDDSYTVDWTDPSKGTAETCAVAHPATGTSQGVPVNVAGVVGTLRTMVPGEIVEANKTLQATSYGSFVGGKMGATTFVDVCITSKKSKKGGKPSERTRGDNTCARIVKEAPTMSEKNQTVECGAVTWQYDNKNGDFCSRELGFAAGSFNGFTELGFVLGIDTSDASVPGAIAGTVCNGRKIICNPSPPTNAQLEGAKPVVIGHTPGFFGNWI